MGRRKKNVILQTSEDKQTKDKQTKDKQTKDKQTKVVKKEVPKKENQTKVAKKRGRKPKKKNDEEKVEKKENKKNPTSKKATKKQDKSTLKKRGRKPKGGKIIHKSEINKQINKTMDSNIVLHLKCKSKDLKQNHGEFITEGGHIISTRILKENPELKPFNPFETETIKGESIIMGINHFDDTILDDDKKNQTRDNKGDNTADNYFSKIEKERENKMNSYKNSNLFGNFISNSKSTYKSDEKKPQKTIINKDKLWENINDLKKKLHFNLKDDEIGACFYCTHGFNTPAIYLPRQIRNDKYEVYGCFCSPECAVGHLKNEKLDHSIFCERYAMLNKIYKPIYNYKKNIKPAPNPHYTLDKYNGNLSIEEYRMLNKCENIVFITDKPMVNIFPELFEDNNVLPTIEKNNLLYKKKTDELRLKRNKSQSSKKSILEFVYTKN